MTRAHPLRVHGGRLDQAEALYPAAPRPFLDLSTGINPHAYPVPAIEPAAWHRLTLARELAALDTAARGFYGADPATAVAILPGTEIGIRLLPLTLERRAARVGIVSPTYGSHASAWRAAGAEVIALAASPTPAEAAAFDVVVIVNPNNPDGRAVAPEILVALGQAMAARGGLLVVDEAFGEVAPHLSLLPHGPLPESVIVLRSVGKFFGLAGARVGFAFGGPQRIARLADPLGDWPIGGPMAVVATVALTDAAWIAATRARLAQDRARLALVLESAGLEVLGGTDLFVFVAGPDDLDHRLGHQGILIRGFDHSPGRFRVGLSATGAELARLAGALTAVL
jgi:cobalamin biosynthesis protein CobC